MNRNPIWPVRGTAFLRACPGKAYFGANTVLSGEADGGNDCSNTRWE